VARNAKTNVVKPMATAIPTWNAVPRTIIATAPGRPASSRNGDPISNSIVAQETHRETSGRPSTRESPGGQERLDRLRRVHGVEVDALEQGQVATGVDRRRREPVPHQVVEGAAPLALLSGIGRMPDALLLLSSVPLGLRLPVLLRLLLIPNLFAIGVLLLLLPLLLLLLIGFAVAAVVVADSDSVPAAAPVDCSVVAAAGPAGWSRPAAVAGAAAAVSCRAADGIQGDRHSAVQQDAQHTRSLKTEYSLVRREALSRVRLPQAGKGLRDSADARINVGQLPLRSRRSGS
jgi:hypothetical protein